MPRGSPSSVSSTSGTTTSNLTPSCWRIARRWGEREARTSGIGSWSAQLGEEDLRLAGGRPGRVGAVDHVRLDLERVVAADRAGGGLERVRGADHLAGGPARPRAPA